jgi:hypothetical protein
MLETHPFPASQSTAEHELIRELNKFCRWLNIWATVLQSLTVITALAAIVLSLVVATYTNQGESTHDKIPLKLLALLSAIFTALFSGFRMRSKAADMRMAYRMLKADLMRYRIGELTASQLITSYTKAEERIGQVEVDSLAERSPAEPPTN